MKEGQRLWGRDELILALNLYYKIPFGKMHSSNTHIVELAGVIGRTPGSVAYKLVNFASLDPSLQARGIKGASNSSKLDKVIWDEFYNNAAAIYYSEQLLARSTHVSIERLSGIAEEQLILEGKSREALVKVRVNQSFFRKSILAAYNNTCCITGIQNTSLLISSHIVPWSVDEKNRLNPRNGIAINALHDKAFENGLITITPDYTIKVSQILKKHNTIEVFEEYFGRYHEKKIILPSKFLPDMNFLKTHNQQFKE